MASQGTSCEPRDQVRRSARVHWTAAWRTIVSLVTQPIIQIMKYTSWSNNQNNPIIKKISLILQARLIFTIILKIFKMDLDRRWVRCRVPHNFAKIQTTLVLQVNQKIHTILWKESKLMSVGLSRHNLKWMTKRCIWWAVTLLLTANLSLRRVLWTTLDRNSNK